MNTRKSEHGQVLVLFIGIILAVLALVSLVVDGGLWFAHWIELQNDADAACLASAIAQSKGWNYATAFTSSFTDNQVEPLYFSPYETGPDGLVIRGVTYGPASTIIASAHGPHEFYLAQFMGLTQMDVAVRTRCTIPDARMLPILVKEPWVIEGLGDPGMEFPILGSGAECDECRGSSFSGAGIPQIWCQSTNCDPRIFYSPATEANSPNQFKQLWSDTAAGTAGSPLVPIGGRIPVLDGVSNSFEVQTVQENFDIGDEIIVMVYSGTIDAPDPSFGNWENAAVIYYARAIITRYDANTVYASFRERIENLDGVRDQLTSRTVSWSWLGEVTP